MFARQLLSIGLGASFILLVACSNNVGHSSGSSSFRGSRDAFPSQIAATGNRIFVFNPQKLAWGAYAANGELVGYGRASGGATWCKDVGRPCKTPAGVFSISRKGGYECYSGKYPLPKGGAHMPYCMFFLNNYAIHGAPPSHVPNYNASHGCIRVTTRAAQWLRHNFIQIGTRVKVLPY